MVVYLPKGFGRKGIETRSINLIKKLSVIMLILFAWLSLGFSYWK